LTKEQFDRQFHYSTVMALVRVMRRYDVINDLDFYKLEKHFTNKYPPLIRNISESAHQ